MLTLGSKIGYLRWSTKLMENFVFEQNEAVFLACTTFKMNMYKINGYKIKYICKKVKMFFWSMVQT